MRIRLIGSLMLWLCASALHANDNTISPITYDALNRVQALLQEGQYPDAKKELDGLANKLNPGFGLALTYQLYGQYWLSQEQPEQAISVYQQALDLAVFAPPQESAILTNIAQLQLSLNDAQAALSTLEDRIPQLLAMEAEATRRAQSTRIVQAPALMTLATALQMQERFADSIPLLLEAMTRSDSVQESWLRMLMVAYFKENDFALAAQVLDRLIAMNPEREEYWEQQTSMYQLLERTDLALRTLELGYVGGYIENADSLRILVQLLIAEGIPERAGRVLVKAIEQGQLLDNEANWRLLAAAWQQARDRHGAALALRSAVVHSDDGLLLLRAAQLFAQDGHHAEVIHDVDAAIARGLSDADRGRALMLAANAAFELQEVAMSRRYFQQALRYAGVAASAREWLNYIALLETN